MDRKAFLSTFWKKNLRPLILTVILCYGIIWLAEAIKAIDFFSTMELVFIITVIVMGLMLLSILLSGIIFGIYSKLPENVKQTLSITSRILSSLAVFGMIGILYYAFTMENYFIAGICAFYIIQELKRMYQRYFGTKPHNSIPS